MMSPALVAILTFACVALLTAGFASVVNDVFFRYRSLINERISDLTGHQKSDSNAAIFDLKLLASQVATPEENWRTRLHVVWEQAGLPIELKTMVGIACCLGIFCAGLAYVAVPHLWIVPVGAALGLWIPLTYANARRNRRVRLVTQQLPDAFGTIARAVRAGQTVPTAFRIVAEEMQPPLADEFYYCYEQQHLGMSHEAALRELARRSLVMEIRILVVALLVQSRSGGNLVELLDNLASMARKRIKMQQHMRALTGEARMQAIVLIVLPIVALGGIIVLAPDYASSLIERPWLLAATGISEFVGALWIRQIVQLQD
jgi:tight adherence protein B